MITNVETKHLKMSFNENLIIENIKFRGKIFIKKIWFSDYQSDIDKQLLKNHPEIPYVNSIINKLKWEFTYINKRKYSQILINAKHKIKKENVKYHFTIKFNDENIIILSKIIGSKKMFAGIRINIKTDIKKIKMPFKTNSNKFIVVESLIPTELIDNNKNICKISSTLNTIWKNDNIISFSPMRSLKNKEEFKKWIINKNNKNSNTILIDFKGET